MENADAEPKNEENLNFPFSVFSHCWHNVNNQFIFSFLLSEKDEEIQVVTERQAAAIMDAAAVTVLSELDYISTLYRLQ